MVQLNFDANSVEPSQPRGDYPVLPEAWYSAYIDESEMKPTKAKTEGLSGNEYLQFRFALMDWADEKPMPSNLTKISGLKYFTRLNIKNTSKEAVEIAYRDLSAIGHAVGVTSIATSDQLHDKPMEIYLKQTIDKNNKVRNEITGYRPCITKAQHNPGQITNVSQPAANNDPIWEQ